MPDEDQINQQWTAFAASASTAADRGTLIARSLYLDGLNTKLAEVDAKAAASAKQLITSAERELGLPAAQAQALARQHFTLPDANGGSEANHA